MDYNHKLLDYHLTSIQKAFDTAGHFVTLVPGAFRLADGLITATIVTGVVALYFGWRHEYILDTLVCGVQHMVMGISELTSWVKFLINKGIYHFCDGGLLIINQAVRDSSRYCE